MRKLLYSLIFIYSSLFSYPIIFSTVYNNYYGFSNDSGAYKYIYWDYQNYEVIGDYYFTGDALLYDCTYGDGYASCHKYYNEYILSSCLDGQELFNGVCTYIPECTDTEYYDSASNTCLPIPDCLSGKYFSLTSLVCTDMPTCWDNSTFDTVSESCTCDSGYIDVSGTCEEDSDGDGIPNSTDTDDDNDGTPDSTDLDSDGDGLLDTAKDIMCQGENRTVPPTITGLSYDISYYRGIGEAYPDDCSYYVSSPAWDSTLSFPDLNPECGYVWCYVHEVDTSSCTDSALAHLPPEYEYFSSITSEAVCSSMVDGVAFSDSSFYTGNLSICPNALYCYLKPINSIDEPSNTEESDTTMEELDLNTTSSDLAPLLQASNTTNKHLQDIKDKTDITHDKLTDIKDVNNKLLTNNQDMKNTLDDIKSNSDKSLLNQLATNSKLESINNGVKSADSKLSSLVNIGLSSNERLNDILDELEKDKDSNVTVEIDLNVTNDLLGGILDTLNDEDSKIDGQDFSDGINLVNNIKDGALSLASDVTSIQDKLATGFSVDNISAGTTPIFSGTVFGNNVSFNLCDTFSTFSSVFYYVFSLIFIWLGIRLFYLGIIYNGRGA